MPRALRELSIDSFHHVYNRGNAQDAIFYDDIDRNYFLKLFRTNQEAFGVSIMSYCLMNNHFHFLLKDSKAVLSDFMKKVCQAYSIYFNCKYLRVGHLCQDRFCNKEIYSKEHFKTVVNYIHLNPVEANLCRSPRDWKYSSYLAITSGHKTWLDINTLLANKFSGFSISDFKLEPINGKFMSFTEIALAEAKKVMPVGLKAVDQRTFLVDYLRFKCQLTSKDVMSLLNISKVALSRHVKKIKTLTKGSDPIVNV